ncbi:MAG: transporter [Methanosphaera stadtmanae]|jgi:predicted transporter|nr:transporter [Methanosphaera stadtmanae]
MLEQFLQYGILAAILVFGVKIGLALGFSGIKRKTVGLILLGYAVGLILLSYICQPYTQQVYDLVYGYSGAIFAVIALIIVITGFKTIYDWKVTQKDVGSATCMAVVAPCPCCFGAILASVILVAPVAGVSTVTLGALSSISLVVVMGLTYLLSSTIVKRINKPYPLVLGNFMIFIGIYFVLCLMILPNISLLVGSSAMQIQSSMNLVIMIGVLLIMIIAGAIIAKKRSYFLQY